MTEDILIRVRQILEGNSLPETKAQLKALQGEMNNTNTTTKEGEARYIALGKAAGELQTHIRGLSREQKGLTYETKMSAGQLLEHGENITVVSAGIYNLVKTMKDLGSELVSKGAELNVLRNGFSGTAEDLEKLKTASAGKLSNIDLYKLSNQASLLNINLKDQATLLGFVEERFDLFGVNLSEGFNKVLNAIQGGTKGLRSLRVDTEQYRKNLEELVKTQGGVIDVERISNEEQEIKIKNLPAEEQLQLRLRAALQTINYTYQDSQNKTRDLKDRTEGLKVAVENAKASIGEKLAKAVLYLGDSLGLTSGKTQEATASVIALGGQLTGLLPVIAQLKMAFPSLGSSVASVFASGGPIVIAIGITIWWVAELINRIRQADQEAKELAAYQKRVKEGTEMGIINPNAPSQQTLDAARKLLEKNPEGDITVEGKTLKLKEWVKSLEDASEKSKQSDYWNQQFNKHQEESSDVTKKLSNSLQEATEKTAKYKKELEYYKGDVSKIPEMQKKYNDALADENKIREQLFGTTQKQKGSSGPRENLKKTESDALTEIINKQKTELDLLELQRDGNANIVFQRRELLKLQLEELKANYITLQYSQDKVKNLEAQKKLNEEIEKSIGSQVKASKDLSKPFEFGDAKGIRSRPGDKNTKASEADSDFEQRLTAVDNFITSISNGLSTIQRTFHLENSKIFSSLIDNVNQVLGIIQTIKAVIEGIETAKLLFKLLGAAEGGLISGPGTGTSDSIPAWLSNGEYVINAKSTSKYLPLLQAINRNDIPITDYNRYASGGAVRSYNQRLQLDVPDVKLKGSDIYLSWKRQGRTESGRKG